ncbi:MAG: type VI secretion system tip protein VgrG [Chloracidobacterium sp.]|nr:type VI secretion system tip protein VgrG [Chloracidobacterium sp.]
MLNRRWPVHLKIDGQNLEDALISRLEIRQELGAHYWLDVEFRLHNHNKPPVASYLGKSIEFSVFDESGSELQIFTGLALEAEMEYGFRRDFVARVRGVTKSYKLQLTPEEHYFYGMNLKDVASKIISEDGLGLQFNADAECAKMNYVQWGESDFDFIRRIADDQGCFMRPTPDGVEIRRGFEDTGQRMRLHDEHGMLSFSIKGRMGQPSFDGACYDPRTMESRRFNDVKKGPQFFPETAADMVGAVLEQSQQFPPDRLVFDGRAPKIQSYQSLLEKESQRALGSKIVGAGVSRNAHLKPGDKIRLEGADFDAEGEYGVISVIHRYDHTNGYLNEFTATPWMDYTQAEQPQPNRMYGVVSGRVVDHNDPRGMGRIQIKYDWMNNERTAWARMTTLYSGGGRGIMFMPEIGDEALVAFEHGDPERPYVIGALWNGVDSAPRQGFWDGEGVQSVGANGTQVASDMARNDIKRIVTKSGHRIQLVDVKGKESIVISTPGNQVIQLIDSCPETGGRQMLSLNSPGDIIINAPEGRVHIRSKYFSKDIG